MLATGISEDATQALNMGEDATQAMTRQDSAPTMTNAMPTVVEPARTASAFTAASTQGANGFDDEDADAQDPQPQESKRSPWLIPLIVIISLAVVIALLAWLIPAMSSNNDDQPTATVTESSTESPQSSEPTEETTEPSEETSEPSESSESPSESESESPEYVEVSSSLIGQDIDKVTSELEGKGLKVNAVPKETDETEPRKVISLNPTGNVEVGETVTVTYAMAPETVEVPSVTGMSFEAAQKRIQDAGLAAAKGEERSDSSVAGTVLSQDVSAGSEVAPGSTVTLDLSTGPEEAPQPSETPTSTPTPTTSPTATDSDQSKAP